MGRGVLGTKSELLLSSGARIAKTRLSDPMRLTGRALLDRAGCYTKMAMKDDLLLMVENAFNTHFFLLIITTR